MWIIIKVKNFRGWGGGQSYQDSHNSERYSSSSSVKVSVHCQGQCTLGGDRVALDKTMHLNRESAITADPTGDK